MGHLNVYDQIKRDLDRSQTQSSRFHSDSLPRVDHGLENWTTQVKVGEGISLAKIADKDSTGFRTLPRKY